jgi:hypothetical protein
MQGIIKNTILFTLLYLLTACTNDFLNENLTPVFSPVGASNIYISPDWPGSNYLFKLPTLKNADYEIVSKPSWLDIDSRSGHLSDSIAVIKCSAKTNSAFSEIGVYMDFLTVKAEGKNYKVPVAYITEGIPTVLVQSSITLSYTYYGNLYLPIQNTGLGILMWNIVSMPDWLAVDTARLSTGSIYIAQYNSYNVPLVIKTDENTTGTLTGTIVLSTNDKKHPRVTVNVTIDLGMPKLSINTTVIDFSSTETAKGLNFGNSGSGRLSWKFEDIPDWLTITPSSGMINSYSSYNYITFNCDRSKLLPGQNTAIVNLKTNDSSHSSYSITVTAIAPGNNENIRAIDGNITDAVFNKNTNTLYFVTSAPNKFIAYDVTAKAILHEIVLSKAPTCFAISEDWTKAAVGHNGTLSAINLSSNTVTATYNSDYSVNDIAWCENDWFCYTQKGGSFSGLHWINTATGTVYDDTDKYSLDGNSFIKKVPNQAYLIATRGYSSPSGFFCYDIASKSKKSYAHMDLTNFWMSEDGQYIYAQNSNIYRTTSSTGSSDTFNNSINAIGKINFNGGYNYGLNFIYHSNHSLWVIQNDSYSTDTSTSIYKFEDNDYTLVKKYAYYPLYQPGGPTTSFKINANYVFANNDGTEISVLCKGTTNSSWIIEFISVK